MIGGSEFQFGLGKLFQPSGTLSNLSGAALVRFDSKDGSILYNALPLDSKSSFFSGRFAADGTLITVGKTLNTETPSTKVNGLITKFGPGPTVLATTILADPGPGTANLEIYGLDFDSQGDIVVVGPSDRKSTQTGRLAAIAKLAGKDLKVIWQTFVGSPGDLVLNDVFVMPNGNYLVAGQMVRQGCTQSDGVVLEINGTDFTFGNLKIVAGTMGQDSFHSIKRSSRGTFHITARMDLAADQTTNPQLADSPGIKEVNIFTDSNGKITAALLRDGTPVNINDYVSPYTTCK